MSTAEDPPVFSQWREGRGWVGKRWDGLNRAAASFSLPSQKLSSAFSQYPLGRCMTIRQWLITSGDIPCSSSQWGQERELRLWMKGGGESAGGSLVSFSLALSLCNSFTHVLKLIFRRFDWGPVVARLSERPTHTGVNGKRSGLGY